MIALTNPVDWIDTTAKNVSCPHTMRSAGAVGATKGTYRTCHHIYGDEELSEDTEIKKIYMSSDP